MINQLANNEAIQRINNNWQALPRNRQRLLLLAFVALVIGLIWAYIYQPIQASRMANTTRINQLQMSLDQMRRDVMEITELSKLATTEQINPAAEAIEKIIKQNADVAALESIFGVNSKVVRLQNGRFQITATNIQYVDWLGNVDTVISRYRVGIAAANITRVADGMVNATLTVNPTR